MFHHDNSNGKSFVKGLFFGAVIGGIAALLLAPKTGKKMREDLCRTCSDISEKTKCVCDSVCEKAEEMLDKAKEIAEEAKEIASSFSKSWKK